jgi:plasmid maintenance system antidote protein VapI
MPARNLTLADKIALLEQIKDQPPNISQHQLAKITVVPKSTIASFIQQQRATSYSWTAA